MTIRSACWWGVALVVLLTGCEATDDAAADPGADASMPADAGDGAMDSGASDAPDSATAADAGLDGSASTEDSAMMAALEAFCEAYVQDVCNWMRDCRGQPCEDGLNMGLTARGRCEASVAGVMAGRLAFDAERAASCTPRPVDLARCRQPPWDGYCDGALTPQQGAGDACDNLGFQYGATLSSCVDGTYCQGQCQQCQAFAEGGEACDSLTDQRCGEGLYCNNGGRCVLRPGLNQPCAEGGSCADGLGCAENVCVALAAPGEPCGPGCAFPGRCHDPEGDAPARCTLYSLVGGACDAEQPCYGQLLCVDGQCAATVPAGAACTQNSQCPEDHRCLDAGAGPVCYRRGAQGEPCPVDQGDLGCREGFVCEGDAGTIGDCQTRGQDGESCEPRGCADGLWCQYPTEDDRGTCRAAQPAGGDCTGIRQLRDSGFARCAGERADCVEGVCRVGGAEGADCNVQNYGPCDEGLWCHGETAQCSPPSADGGPCQDNIGLRDGREVFLSCQDGLYCVCDGVDCLQTPGTCRPTLGEGDPCDFTEQCAAGLLCDEQECRAPASCSP